MRFARMAGEIVQRNFYLQDEQRLMDDIRSPFVFTVLVYPS